MAPNVFKDTSASRGDLLKGFFLLLALNLLVYGPSLNFGFLVNSDDQSYIFRNPYLRPLTLSNLFAIFSNAHVFHTYVPLTMISYSLDYTFWQMNPAGYHLTQILLHAGNAFLIFVIVRRLDFSCGIALVAAAVYSVHPIHVESVVWISERKNILSAFFLLSACFFYLRYAHEGRARDYWVSCGLFLCGLLSKSIAVVLPLALILYDLCLARRGWRLREKIPYFAASLVLGAFTLYGEGGRAGAIVEYAGGSVWINLLYTLRVYVDYLFSLLFPFQLSPYYHYQAWDLLNWKSICSYIVIPFAVVTLAVNWRTRTRLAFAAGWFVIWLLPVSNIIPLNTLRQDRYLYLAALGPFLVFLDAVSSLRWIKYSAARGLLCAGTMLAALAFVTVRYVDIFADSGAYWLRVAKVCPNWAAAQYEAGVVSWSAGDVGKAMDYYRKAVRANPAYSLAWNNLGAVWLDRGRYGLAEIYIKRAVQADSNNAAAYYNLAMIASKTGRSEEEINAWLKKSKEINAARREKDYNLGGYTSPGK